MTFADRKRLLRPAAGLTGIAILVAGLMAADDEPDGAASQPAAAKAALADFNSLIGGWRGVGQPKRNSNRDAWREEAEWLWDFADSRVAIVYKVSEGRLLQSAEITWAGEGQSYLMNAVLPDGTERKYAGELDDNRLVMETDADDDGNVHRITITRLNRKRTIVLFERRATGRSTYSRVAGVGYTRKGTSLAVAGGGARECVVTGGTGTMPVEHNGKTYYVCCTGCLQAFQDDPEGILAEYRERLRERRKKLEE